jgi:arylsulfatase
MKQCSISRRRFLQGSLAVSAGVVTQSNPQVFAKDTAKARPNVLVIFSDQQHWQAMGCMDSFFDTPHLDALAREATVFENSFCTTPQCSPSRSSLLTGCYPHRTEVMGNVGAAGGKALAQKTIASELKAAGYHTGYFGKWHLGNQAVANAGWDQSHLKINDPGAQSRALAFLKQAAQSTQPFALFVSINNPHDIYNFKRHKPDPAEQEIALPPSWKRETFSDKPSIHKQFMLEDQGTAIWGKEREVWEQYRDCYRSKTRLYDKNVGAVLGELKRQGLWDNTIVIATSDHGDMDANHRLIYKGPFMYEHMLRVPLIIRVPAKFGGTVPQQLTQLDVVNVDIAPTIRELCGLTPTECDGKSLGPILTGTSVQKTRDFVIGQYYSKQRWVNPIRMIRTPEFKFNRYIYHGEELYDLKKDPHELKNLAENAKYADIKMDMSRALDRWIKENEDPFNSHKASTRNGEPITES